MNTHFFEWLKSFQRNRKLKIANYLSLLEVISEDENRKITEEFFIKEPIFSNEKSLKDLLKSYVNRGVIPDEGLLISLEEYFKLRVEKS